MLPDSTQIRNNSNVAKFADTGIDELIRQMENLGASKSRLVAKMAGGAQMFAMASQNESLRVGERNAAAVIVLIIIAPLKKVAAKLWN